MKHLILFAAAIFFEVEVLPRLRADAFAAANEYRILLRDGTYFQGTLAAETLTVAASSGETPIKTNRLERLTPGLNRRPDVLRKIERLIRRLGAAEFVEREKATQELHRLGPWYALELERRAITADAEARYRIRKVLELWKQRGAIQPQRAEDVLETSDGVFQGKLLAESLEINTHYGTLNVRPSNLAEMRRTEQIEVDLLRRIDPRRDSVRGEWSLRNGALVSPGNLPWALLNIPYRPPREYTLEATVERKSGTDALVFPLVLGSAECNLCLDGWPRGELVHTGLELIRGQGPPTNGFGHRGRLLVAGKRTKLKCVVEKNSVQLTCNGRPIFAWQGDPQGFTMQPEWTRPDKTALGVGSYLASFEITELRLTSTYDLAAAIPVAAGSRIITTRRGARFVLPLETRAAIPVETNEGKQTIDLAQIASLRSEGAAVRITRHEGEPYHAAVSGAVAFEITAGAVRVPGNDLQSIWLSRN